MAARLKPHHTEDVKAKIQVIQLLLFLQKHALEGKKVDSTRVDAAKFLINKVLANPATEFSGPNGGPIEFALTDVAAAAADLRKRRSS